MHNTVVSLDNAAFELIPIHTEYEKSQWYNYTTLHCIKQHNLRDIVHLEDVIIYTVQILTQWFKIFMNLQSKSSLTVLPLYSFTL